MSKTVWYCMFHSIVDGNVENDNISASNWPYIKRVFYILSEYSQYLTIILFYNDKFCNNYELLKNLQKVRLDNNNNNLIFLKVDVVDNPEIISELDVTTCPIIYFYKNSEKKSSIYATYDNIIELINEKINKYLWFFGKKTY